jgi:[acyl-carrier-protein] S-malonyltransferase
VELANLNAPGQLIVSGARDAITRLTEQAASIGVRRVLPLTVGGPFHSAYMRPAADRLQAALDRVAFERPRVPIVLNVSADATSEPEALRHELAEQVFSPVQWIRSLRQLADMGCDQFVEVGPGQVIAGLVKRTLPTAQVVSFGSLADLDGVRSLLLEPAG